MATPNAHDKIIKALLGEDIGEDIPGLEVREAWLPDGSKVTIRSLGGNALHQLQEDLGVHRADPEMYLHDLGPGYNLRCIGCGLGPEEIRDYDSWAREAGMTNTEFVQSDEGTLNPHNGHFACDSCYARLGSPVGERGSRWVAP